jgi:uncharacterized protein YdeI (YjbR/CyaY-like superfamily)
LNSKQVAEKGKRVEIENRSAWRNWLEQNHDRSNGIWLVTFKKQNRGRYVPRNELIEEAICFGWIDSLPRKLDDDRTMLWMAPRKPGSGWSQINKERAKSMIAAGRMAPAGLEKVNIAKSDGSWNALDAIEALEIPGDLEQALAPYPAARKNFDAFPRSVKRSILEWISSAKKPETRAKRIDETARLAEANIRANQWRKKPTA